MRITTLVATALALALTVCTVIASPAIIATLVFIDDDSLYNFDESNQRVELP